MPKAQIETEGVLSELEAGGQECPGRAEVVAAPWVELHEVRNRPLVSALCQDLDPGESETIALGLEISSDLVLMDEREGRHRARRLGLRTMGVVGVLLLAKEQGTCSSATLLVGYGEDGILHQRRTTLMGADYMQV